jgi:hypothetical protein
MELCPSGHPGNKTIGWLTWTCSIQEAYTFRPLSHAKSEHHMAQKHAVTAMLLQGAGMFSDAETLKEDT